jgi:RNA polymerase sigma factor (sigma-70 family)
MNTTFLAQTIRTDGAYLLRYARRLTHNDADATDLLQDTCVQALEAAGQTDYPDHPRTWLVTVMRNRWFNIVRHRRVRRTVQAALAQRTSVDDSLCETRVACDQLSRAWSQLPAQAQLIAEQCLIDEDSHDDVSRRFGITAGGVATSIHRTRSSLRKTMFGESY